MGWWDRIEGEHNGVGFLRPAGTFLLVFVSAATTLLVAGASALWSAILGAGLGAAAAAWAATARRDGGA